MSLLSLCLHGHPLPDTLTPPCTLTIDTVPWAVCTGATFDVHFSVSGGFTSSDSFIVELSLPTGVFPNPPLIVGTGTSSPISVTIPTVPTGNLYRLRITKVGDTCMGSSRTFWIVDISGISFFCEANPSITLRDTVELIANVSGLFVLPYDLKLKIDPGDGSPVLVDSNLGFPYVYRHFYAAPGIYTAHFVLEYHAPGCRKECSTTVYVPILRIDSVSRVVCAGESLRVAYTQAYFPPATDFAIDLLDGTGQIIDSVLSPPNSSSASLYLYPSLVSSLYQVNVRARTTPPLRSDTAITEVINLQNLICSASPALQLPEHPITFSLSGTGLPSGPFSVEINFGDGGAPLLIDTVLSLPLSTTHSYHLSGSYTVSFTVKHLLSGCVAYCSTQVQISGTGLYILNLHPQKVCGGDSLTIAYVALGFRPIFANLYEVSLQNSSGQTWSLCTMPSQAAQSTLVCQVPPDMPPDTYFVKVRSTAPVYESEAWLLVVAGSPEAEFDMPRQACAAEKVTFLNRSRRASSYQWDFGDGRRSSEASPTHIYDRAGVYPVRLTAHADGHCTHTATRWIEILPRPTAAFSVEPETVYLSTQSTARILNSSTGAARYLWDFGDGRQSSEHSPSLAFTEPGTYHIQLIAIAENGCRDTATYTLSIRAISLTPPPNFFSPNGDGINDELRIPYTGMQWISLAVYDRWGKLLHQQISHTPEGHLRWDGSTATGPAPEGAYGLVIEGTALDGQIVRHAFTVTLLR